MEVTHVIEVAHILAGPLLAILITALAFHDDALIQGKLEAFFRAKNTGQELAQNTKDMMAGAIALATFLGNVYVLAFNCLLAFIVYPAHYIKTVAIIGSVAIICFGSHAIYLLKSYELLELGEETTPLPWNTQALYPKFLRWEQFTLSILTLIYFGVGIYLNPKLGLNMKVLSQILATFGPILLVIMGIFLSISPFSTNRRMRWKWLAAFLVLGIPIAAASFVELHGSDIIGELIRGYQGQ